MKRCIVHDCKNHQGEGLFIGDICLPCYNMIVTGNDNPSANFIHRLHGELKLQDAANEILTKRLEENEIYFKRRLLGKDNLLRSFRNNLLSMNNTFRLYRPETAKSIDDFLERTRGL